MASYVCRQCRANTAGLPVSLRSFATSASRSVRAPASNLADSLSPTKAPRPPTEPIPSRAPSGPFDSSDPFLLPTGDQLSKESIPRTQDSKPEESSRTLINTIRKSLNSSYNRQSMPRSEFLERQKTSQAQAARRQAVEQQQSRIWREGDVYTPHDLSPVEQMKAKAARAPARARDMRPVNTRKGGGKDVLDDLAINPIMEYKNFAMMSEFTTAMGRIRHGRDTGFRAVNQRKMAKAVRRARGMGLLPSVHRHPELHPERYQLRFGDLPSRSNQSFN